MELMIGDVVKLKSGSPTMTIQDIGDYSNHGIETGVLCVWFDSKGKHEEIFRPEMLAIYSPPPQPKFAETD
jgi:uncharacterized protein YodC (DUF2158 family)